MTAAAAAIRSFFALWPDAAARAALHRIAQGVATQVRGNAPREENMHVTLAFLGNVPHERLDALIDIGALCARDARAFTLTLDRIGGTSKGIAWLAPGMIPAELASLHEALVARLGEAGFPVERRRFRPHVTLARRCTAPARRRDVEPIAWTVDRLALVASTPAPGGSRYADTAAWPFGGSLTA